MKKYIAGFRSDNPKNKKKALIYYVAMIIIFVIGSERSASDMSCLLITLLTPSIILNFKQMISKNKSNDKYEKITLSKSHKIKAFVLTLIPYILACAIFDATYVEPIDDSVANNKTSIESSVKEESDVTEDISSKEEVKDEIAETENIIEIKESEIHFINTGNSDAILIKQGDKAALIDGGDNDDESKVVSYLKNQGVTELEYVFATHPHADHIGGLDAVVDSIPVKNIYVSNGDADTQTYSDFITSMANKGLNPSVPLLNSEFKLGTSTFKVLSVANESEPNNNSLVLLYTNGEDKVLLMGDAESEIESKINVSDVDLLKVGHHGSHSSSNPSFIDKVNPQYAVITAGENNKYGHPHKETMDTLENRSIEVHRNDECGHVVFKSTGEGLTVDCKVGSYESGEDKEVAVASTPMPEPTVEPEPVPEVSVTPEPPAPKPEVETKMVWLSATGDKAHSIPNCGRMNPNKARKVPDTGYDYCSKCW